MGPLAFELLILIDFCFSVSLNNPLQALQALPALTLFLKRRGIEKQVKLYIRAQLESYKALLYKERSTTC